IPCHNRSQATKSMIRRDWVMAEIHTHSTKKESPNQTLRVIYALLSAVFAVCVLVQVLFAGTAIFMGSTWENHTNFVHFFEFILLFMLVFAFVGRLRRHGLRWWPIILFAFISFQYASAEFPGTWLAAFHPVVALILFVSACYVTLKAWKYGD